MDTQVSPQISFTREQAYQIVLKYLQNPNLIKHSLAAEAAMKGIYNYLYFGKAEYNEEIHQIWDITGLLHDADYDMTKGKPDAHGIMLFDYEKDIPPAIKQAIKSHNPATGIRPQSQLDWGIRCADQLTGLIVAAALVHPDKKLAPLTVEFVLNRLNEKSFAKGADREPIRQCQDKLGISLELFISIILKAMQEISTDLGL